MTSTHQVAKGFVLGEIILVLVIASVVTAALLAGLITLVRGLQPQSVTITGEVLPIAPTFGAYPAAVRFHQDFVDRVTASRAVYVFGGEHLSLPTGAPPAALLPLRARALPVIANFSNGLPMDAETFHRAYAAAGLGDVETGCSPEDFSVVVVGPASGSLAVTCFVQVRRREVSVSDGTSSTAFIVREATLWDIDNGRQRYAFVERPTQAAGVFVGAVHTWMRYHPNRGGEEGPACVVFPDPWLFTGARGRPDDIPAFSRFSYFLPVSP